jgi:hypothetical protein
VTAMMIERATGRSLLSEDLFERLVWRIAAKEKVDQALAERIMDQGLAFLGACASDHAEPLVPSELVDIGWHTFILYTQDYADFCDRVAGRFIHHTPHDDTSDQGARQADSSARILAAIEAAGYITDPDLWAGTTQDCSASGKDGNENTETQIPPPIVH